MSTNRGRGGGTGSRDLTVRVKSGKKRKLSSRRWLERQLNDPYVASAQREGYKSRAAYKLIELDDRFRFLKRGMSVIDLGAAPGGWTQVAAKRTAGQVVAIDLLEMDPIQGADIMLLDFMSDEAPDAIKAKFGGPVDAVLSDMAPPTIGHAATDHLRIVTLAEAAFYFACEVLAPGGVFVAKVFQGGAEGELLTQMKKRFTSVKHAKPPASRAGSAEVYVVASGFRPN